MSLLAPSLPLAELDKRARHVFRDIVETYLQTGQPVGSRTISMHNRGQAGLSAASIRNTMADLAALGLLSAPHSSAGRLPTDLGLRLFVDGLLELGDLPVKEQEKIEKKLAASGRTQAVLESASQSLAGLAGGAGLVLAPAEKDAPLRHVEFVGLDGGQALAVLVYSDGHVENRLMALPDGLPPAALERAGNFLSARLKGRHLSDARRAIETEIKNGEAALDSAAAGLVTQGIAAWAAPNRGARSANRNLIVRGQAQLLDNADVQSDLERIRLLFEDLEKKHDLIALLDNAEAADGVKIFIGAENPLFSLSGSSVVVAPYHDVALNIIGAVGVIGPTRLNYARVIPMVDYTAETLGRILQSSHLK